MAYAPPIITDAGLIIPSFTDIQNYLIGQFQIIYGSASFLGVSSADFQDISIRALQANYDEQCLQAVYLSNNPLTAIGTSLDQIGVLIGTARKQASYSTVLETLTGTPGTVITSGVVRDINGNYWSLATPATIGGGGTVNVIATAQNLGAITANPGDVSTIATPTSGWTAATNAAAASPGQPVEPDSTYRARLLISQAKPSLTLLAGTVAAVAAVEGVTRSVVYENPTNNTASYGVCNTSGTAVTITSGYATDASDDGQPITINGVVYAISTASGFSLVLSSSAGTQTGVSFQIGAGTQIGPAHSITTVVEGGSQSSIAQAIYDNRGIGCLTNGTTSVNVTDPQNPSITMPIGFDILGYVYIYVTMNVHGLNGFTSATQAAIQASVVAYLNSLGIGETVVYSELYGAALEARPNPDQPLFSIRALDSGAALAVTTGSTTASMPNVTLASGAGTANGQVITGAGIPNGTTISSGGGTTSIVMSANATATASGVQIMTFSPSTVDVPIGYASAAAGLVVNVVVNTV